MRRSITTLTAVLALALTGSAAARASAGGHFIIVRNHAGYSVNADGSGLHRLFTLQRWVAPIAVSRDGSTVVWSDAKHGYGYPDQVAQGIVLTDLHGGHRRQIGYGSDVVLSTNGWIAINGFEPSCTHNPCEAITIERLDGSQKHVLEHTRLDALAWSPDGTQLAVLKGNTVMFITRAGRRVGRMFVLPKYRPQEEYPQQGSWAHGVLYLSAGDGQGDGWMWRIDLGSGHVDVSSGAAQPTVWTSPHGKSAVVGGVLIPEGYAGVPAKGAFVVDAWDDFLPWSIATDNLGGSSVPPVHPLFTSETMFQMIGWTR